MKLSLIAICLAICFTAFAVEPPVYNFSYHITFDDTFVVDNKSYTVNGQQFYDPINNRQRVDRSNGRYDLFCGGVLPNISTPCTHYTINNKRYLAFPQKSQCCFCCDSAHGCGILKPDWLKDAKYLGEDTIVDTKYDKWSLDGMFGYNYQWVTQTADKIPRKLDQGGEHITQYSTHSFRKQNFPDSVFALPQYCNPQNNCPLDSICGKLRMNKINTQ